MVTFFQFSGCFDLECLYNGAEAKLCSGITPKIINLQPIMIHHRIFLIAESAYNEKNCGRTTHQVACRIRFHALFLTHTKKY